ncbi:MAG: Lrp/AsnC family transcriptional regulator [Deltaproteobacteria bacterium]|nr:Lrp/AsnC family transcriptional regulator [Deltaproteobacteria bacterium]MBW1914918.1 Lrp/AsnC family transcriptional regulator [Deltaproteobacteria bacterium]
MIDETDKKIIALAQKDIPLEASPYAVMAGQVGISEQEFLKRVQSMIDQGIIRRFGATLWHQEAGFNSNAMVAWVVSDQKVEDIGEIMAGFHEVTHCYQRNPQKDWRFNLYTMVHGDTRDDCYKTAERMSEKTGIREYTILFSTKEFKKTSMEYF